MLQHTMFELSFSAPAPAGSFAQPDLTAEFVCGDHKTTVKGFYDGKDTYKVRFLPERCGEYHWKVSGIVNAEGKEICEADENHHGMVVTEGYHFRYADGTRFTPFGTTVYALAHQPDELVAQTLETLSASPFNKVRMCVFPKHFTYNNNEPPFYPFERKADGGWDVQKPDLDFWHRFEDILYKLAALDIQVDLILFHPYDHWGFASLSQEDNLIYLDTVIRRLSAMPNIWWSLANEYDVCAEKSMEDWQEIEEFVADSDPSHHLLSNHHCYQPWDASRPNITHCSMQTKSLNRVAEWQERYGKPVMVDECCYEGNISSIWGCISAKNMVSRFWKAVVTGGYCTHGETYLDDNDVLWWAKGGVLHGESPARIAFLRKLVEELPGPIENTPDHIAGAVKPENRERVLATLQYLPKGIQDMFKSLFRCDERELMFILDGEMCYMGHIGEDVFLTYYDRRCCAEDTLRLPKEGSYQIDVIDTWEMTRQTVAEHVNGAITIRLPGKEGMAVIASKMV
ncbi:MAG: DUF5605 domain-containing protein [Faecousia sp.]